MILFPLVYCASLFSTFFRTNPSTNLSAGKDFAVSWYCFHSGNIQRSHLNEEMFCRKKRIYVFPQTRFRLKIFVPPVAKRRFFVRIKERQTEECDSNNLDSFRDSNRCANVGFGARQPFSCELSLY